MLALSDHLFKCAHSFIAFIVAFNSVIKLVDLHNFQCIIFGSVSLYGSLAEQTILSTGEESHLCRFVNVVMCTPKQPHLVCVAKSHIVLHSLEEQLQG